MSTAINATDALIDTILRLVEAPLPGPIEARARLCVLDFIGTAFAGAHINRQSMGRMRSGEPGACDLIGWDGRTGAREAAFINAFNAHTTELDDGSRFGMIHLGASIIPAVIAAAQAKGIACERALKGIVAGYEAAVRTSLAMQPSHKKRGFHTSGTCGAIGAAVAVACAMGCDRTQLKAAVSAAATSAAGLLEIQEDASTLKPYNVGHAAMAGLNAAWTGMAGFVGPEDILGGSRGMLRLLSDEFDPAPLSAPAEHCEIERIYVKPYAACRHCHTAIEAILRLRQRQVPPEDIQRIEIDTYELAVRGHDHTDIRGAASARLSMPFVVAAAYVLGSAGMESFTDEALSDARIRALANKVRVRADEQMSRESGRKRAARVRLIAPEGEVACTVDYAKGDPENPMSRDEQIEKFRLLMRWAGAQEKADGILRLVLQPGQ